MKSARLTSLFQIASFTILLQSAVLAAEYPDSEIIEMHTSSKASKTEPLYPGFSGKDGPQGFDGKDFISLQPGQSLPILDIQVGGEIDVSGNKVVKKPWSSKSFESKGKVQLVQYVAANWGAARQNKSFNDNLIEKRFTSEKLDTTVIVHLADTVAFLQGFVVKKIAKNKEKYQTINFVIDDNGLGLERWGMKNKSCAIIILDANGKVLFAKDGPLSEIEIENTIKLIEKQMS
jgi:hypothetical protein